MKKRYHNPARFKPSFGPTLEGALKGILMIILFSLLPLKVAGQNGYVKLQKNDSLKVGFVRYYVSKLDGHHGIELWKTKKDKNPNRFPLASIYEYSLKKDTFRILQNFTPFFGSSARFDLVEAKVLSSGKVNLLKIENYVNPKRISTYTGGGIVPLLIDELNKNLTYMYLLEDTSSGYLRALPSKPDKLFEILITYFPEICDINNQLSEVEIKYKSIPKLVKLYNAREERAKTE